jgi:hypothetical protein
MDIVITPTSLIVYNEAGRSMAEWKRDALTPAFAWAIIGAIQPDDREALDAVRVAGERVGR